MLGCWDEEPKNRPTFTQLRSNFDNLISNANEDTPYIDLSIDMEQSYYNCLYSEDMFTDIGSNEDVVATVKVRTLQTYQRVLMIFIQSGMQQASYF